jgi:hypothetical protein
MHDWSIISSAAGTMPLAITAETATPAVRIDPKSATTSGVIYARGSPISYTSCSVTEATFTTPPVSGCFVITKVPSGAPSAMG